MWWMLKNSSGRPDAVLTLTVLGFLVVIVKVLLAGAVLVIGANSYKMGEIDAATIAAVLTPTLGSYCARRWTDKKHSTNNGSNEAPKP